VIFVLPFVSLIAEKERKLTKLCEILGLKFQSIHSHKRAQFSEDMPNLILCTVEKANQLINKIIETKQIHKVCCLAVDELHLIGDEQRGYLMELILSKLCFLKDVQIIAMSATFPNIRQVAQWLNSELYITDFRPVKVDEYIKQGASYFKIMRNLDRPPSLQEVKISVPPARVPKDRLGIWDLVVPFPGQSLVFCQTKLQCEELAGVFYDYATS
jgi:DNA polymerase theta